MVFLMSTGHAASVAATRERQIQLTLRVPQPIVERLEKLAEAMSGPVPLSPTAVLRYVVEQGLEAAEAEFGTKPASAKPAGKKAAK